MKKGKLLVLAALGASICLTATSCTLVVNSGSSSDSTGTSVNEVTHERVYGEWTITAEPTEDSAGKAQRTYTVDGASDEDFLEEKDIPALSDESVWKIAANVAPTHSAAGSKIYTSVYGVVTVTVQKLAEHQYGAWTLTQAPTEESAGKAERVCAENDDTEEADVAALTDETVWTVEVTPATHTAAGKKVYTSVYGTITVEIPVQAHEYGDWTFTVQPTETAAGTAVRICAADNHAETAEVPALTDTSVWTVEVKEATETERAKKVYTSMYGTVEVVAAEEEHEHEYGDWAVTVQPTETTAGTAVRICAADNHAETAEVPALTDETVWTVEVTPATHAAAGKKVYTSVYGTVTVEIPAEGHAYGDWTFVTEPTEESAGKAERVCSDDGAIETAAVPALTDESVWSVEVTEPSYTAAGSKVYTSDYGTVTVDIPQLTAPYVNKTYSNFAFDARSEEGRSNRVLTAETAWNTQTIDLDENGEGTSTGFVFRDTKITMVNAATGEVDIYTNGTHYKGYVDFETGLMVRPYSNSFEYLFVFTPFEIGASSSASKASAWDNAMAIAYTYEDTTYTIFVYGDKVYFGVTFEDADGNAVAAEDCYRAPSLYVKDSKGNLIAAFGFDGTKEVALDGLQGTYANGEDSITVSGYGTVTLGEETGTYTVTDGVLSVYVGGSYYEVTLNTEEKTYTSVKPTVTLTFEAGEYAAVESQTVNQNIAYALPVPENETMTFKGWFYDAEFTRAVAADFVPTEDVTLYAKWAAKVVVNVVIDDETTTVLTLGEGDEIGSLLPVFGVDEDNNRIFRGWYLDENYTETLPEEAELSKDDSGISIYAKWDSIPAYYGTYLGTELWNASYGNSNSYSITIDENGNISGSKTGVVLSYDPATQAVTWATSATSTTVNKFFFDAESGVIAGLFKNTSIATDFYILSRYQTTNKVEAHYGVQVLNPNTGEERDFYSHFITLTTKNGVQDIVLYGDRIYSNVVIEDVAGNALTASTVSASKTVIVKDGATGEVIFAVASQGASFSANTNTDDLDAYYGTYTNGEETLVLDGVGGVVYGEKTGTYAAAASAAYDFEVYLNDSTEYYRLTLDGESFTLEKPTATVTYVSAQTAIEAQSANINVPFALPELANTEGYVFRGWYLDEGFETAVGANFVPTEDTFVYAKWLVKATFTAVYNNEGETENYVYEYGAGEVAELADATYTKHKFEGWFTSATFDEGTEWTSGTVIESALTVYAKWSVAPVYNNTYKGVVIITGTTENGESSASKSSMLDDRGPVVDIDPNGYVEDPKYYPFNGGNKQEDIQISDYNTETGELVFNVGSTAYRGFVDANGILIVSNTTDSDITTVWFFTPFEAAATSGAAGASSTKSNLSSSYWNSGKTRAIQYTYDGTTYSYFIYNNTFYAGVSFKDSKGNAVAGADCYHSATLYVYDANGELIVKCGYNGTTMVDLDGNEGAYTSESGASTLIFDGVEMVTFNGAEGTYTAAAEDAGYDFDVYVGGRYYEVTLDKENNTYTMNKPMVTVTYNTSNYVWESMAINTNKNIAIDLPVLTNPDYVFRGWYLDDAFTTAVEAGYAPSDSVTLYAKWDKKVTLTVVYGNGLDTVTQEYGAGDAVVLVKPAYTNNLSFNGWYLDEDLTIPYAGTGTVITENTTVYCAWKEGVEQAGTYKGWNLYSSGTGNQTTFGTTLTIADDGTVSGNRTGTVQQGEDGVFYIVGTNTWYAYYESTLGIVWYAYLSSGNATSVGTDTYFLMSGDITRVDYVRYSGTVSGSAYTALLKLTYGDGSVRYVAAYNNVVYADVTWDEEIEFSSITNTTSITVRDSAGNEIFTK